MRGGLEFSFMGKPAPLVEDFPLPPILRFDRPVGYALAVHDGDIVRRGELLFRAEEDGVTLGLPAPAAGRVRIEADGAIHIQTMPSEENTWQGEKSHPERCDSNELRRQLQLSGIWRNIASAARRWNWPSADSQPKEILVKAAFGEPFLPDGEVLLQEDLDAFCKGLAVIRKIAACDPHIHAILPEKMAEHPSPFAERIRSLEGVICHFLPEKYPVENDPLLARILLGFVPPRHDPPLDPREDIWSLPVHTVQDIARCLADAMPPARRVIVLGGAGCRRPRHIRVYLGTPLSLLLQEELLEGPQRVILGGLLTGRAVEMERAAIGMNDLAVNAIPLLPRRRFLSFIWPGLDRHSYAPMYLGRMLKRSLPVTASKQGELRACVSCGFCEEVCPAGIMPHLIFRLLEQDMLDEIERARVDLCVECELCTYVCVSKIELARMMKQAKKRLMDEG